MLKIFTKKIKNLFTKKKVDSKPTKKENTSVAEKKESPKREFKKGNKQHPRKKNYNKNRKKETPEEYRARHERLAQERNEKSDKNQNKVKAEKKVILQKEKPAKPTEIVDNWKASEFKVDVVDGKTRFHDLKISDKILHAIYDLGFEYCTDVQAETLPQSLMGNDVTAQAQTGTGKTAAFLITLFNHFINKPLNFKRKKGTPRALILAPTRELVLQIEKDAKELGKYVPCNILAILGGMQYNKQMNVLKTKELDIVICTPGRLIDFMKKRLIDLRKVEILVIDEADRMLDMGFIPDVKKIVVSTPQKSKRQTMFFTATMSDDVKNLSQSWTKQAFDVTIAPDEIATKNVEQLTYITTLEEKPILLYNIITQKNLERVLIFVNRRDDARRLKDTLDSHGISVVLLTGDVDQKRRISRLEKFREGKVRVLVATDVASRGIHVEGISHVINYNLPTDVEEYVHRIGRTGRAGASGTSISFADEQESYEIPKLEEFLGNKIECTFPDEVLLKPIPEAKKVQKKTDDKEKNNSRKSKRNYNSKNRKHYKKKPYSKGTQKPKENNQ